MNCEAQVFISPPNITPGINPTIVQLLYGTLNNPGATLSNVYLHLTCTTNNVLIADVSSNSFLLPSGLTTINAHNAESLLYPVKARYTNNTYVQYATMTSTLIPGSYEICVTVLKKTNDSVVGKNCFSISVENFTAISLLTPLNGSTITSQYPTCTWTRVAGSSAAFGSDIYYMLRMVEVIEGQSPEIAMQSNPSVFKEDGISFNLFDYPITSHPLEPCGEYAWQIDAFQGYGVSKRKLVSSEIWHFRVTCEERIHWTPHGQPPGGNGPTPGVGGNGKPKLALIPLKANSKCENYLVELKKTKKGETAYYNVAITNKYSGTDTNFIPKSFVVKIKNDSIAGISDSAQKGLTRTPKAIPPNTTNLVWTNERGSIPTGKIDLGNLFLKSPDQAPLSLVYEWRDMHGKTICKDSLSFLEPRYYYDLSKVPSNNYSEVSDTDLNVQYVNNYASGKDLKITIYDIGARKSLEPSGENSATKSNSITGLNRLSIDLKNYKPEAGKLYQLIVSDFNSNYYFNFKVAKDREQ